MKNKAIAGHTPAPGEVIRDLIHVPGTKIDVPYVLLGGKRDGPTLLLTAGIHSAEFVGIQAAIELSRELETEELGGTVCILPLVNRSGFENRTMSMVFEDGKNLNRVFPGSSDGSPADVLAYTVFETFIRQADYYVDLHSGDGFEALTPYVYYLGDGPAARRAEQMTECVDVPYCVQSRCRTGGAYNLASVRGIPSILIERGQLSLLCREEVEADKSDVRNILRQVGILPGSWTAHPKTKLWEYSDDAPLTGCWYPKKQVGEYFRKGEKLGEIRDYFGRSLFVKLAPEDGVLLHQCASLNIIEKGPMVTYGVLQYDPA